MPCAVDVDMFGTNTAVQDGVPNPPWGSINTDRLGYDGVGRNIAKQYQNSSGTLVGFTTAYDPASNKAYERELHAENRSHLYLPIPFTGVAPAGPAVPAGYDSLNRLQQYQRGTLSSSGGIGGNGGGYITSAITLPGTNKVQSYNMDGLGNWKSTTPFPVSGTFAADPSRQHNSVNQVTFYAYDLVNSGPVLYDHGDNAASGDPLKQQRGNGNIANDKIRTYKYDALNRLIQVNGAGTGTPLWANYTYDALGRRIRKTVSNGGVNNVTALNGTTDYLYDGQQIIEDRSVTFSDGAGTETTAAQYVWGIYIDELIQLKAYVALNSLARLRAIRRCQEELTKEARRGLARNPAMSTIAPRS